jgi:Fe-S-cluster-containing hydrogenase component 2
MADRVLITDPSICTGCRTCEIVCSLSHDGEINPHRSRIRILQQEDAGLDVPVVCQQCSYTICRHVCPAKAITRDAGTGAMLIDAAKCTGCELCVYACFFGAIKLRKEDGKRKAFVCDLCGGDPMCAKFCDTRAIAYVPEEQIILAKKSESMRETLFRVGRITSNSRESRLLERITAVRDASPAEGRRP